MWHLLVPYSFSFLYRSEKDDGFWYCVCTNCTFRVDVSVFNGRGWSSWWHGINLELLSTKCENNSYTRLSENIVEPSWTPPSVGRFNLVLWCHQIELQPFNLTWNRKYRRQAWNYDNFQNMSSEVNWSGRRADINRLTYNSLSHKIDKNAGLRTERASAWVLLESRLQIVTLCSYTTGRKINICAGELVSENVRIAD